jgi:Asp/Glu/hydantoin racemase
LLQFNLQEARLRILLIIPWAADEQLISYEREFVPSDVDITGLKEGSLVECATDLVYNLPSTIDAVADAERQGYDAVVIACFSDTGVEAARELVSIPVLGPL